MKSDLKSLISTVIVFAAMAGITLGYEVSRWANIPNYEFDLMPAVVFFIVVGAGLHYWRKATAQMTTGPSD